MTYLTLPLFGRDQIQIYSILLESVLNLIFIQSYLYFLVNLLLLLSDEARIFKTNKFWFFL